MTTKKKPQPPKVEIPAGLLQKRIADLSLDERLMLTLMLLSAGHSLGQIGRVRRMFDAPVT